MQPPTTPTLRPRRRTCRLRRRRPEASPATALLCGERPLRGDAARGAFRPRAPRSRHARDSYLIDVGGSSGGLAAGSRVRGPWPGESVIACRERFRKPPRAASRTPPRPRRAQPRSGTHQSIISAGHTRRFNPSSGVRSSPSRNSNANMANGFALRNRLHGRNNPR